MKKNWNKNMDTQLGYVDLRISELPEGLENAEEHVEAEQLSGRGLQVDVRELVRVVAPRVDEEVDGRPGRRVRHVVRGPRLASSLNSD